jgi:putative transposase
LHFQPKLTKYRKGNGYALVTYPKQALKLVGSNIKIPLGNTVKRWFKLDRFTIPMPSNLNFAEIKELRLLPKNQYFYAKFFSKKDSATRYYVNPSNALSIDPGINNCLSYVSNVGTSFIVDGRSR